MSVCPRCCHSVEYKDDVEAGHLQTGCQFRFARGYCQCGLQKDDIENIASLRAQIAENDKDLDVIKRLHSCIVEQLEESHAREIKLEAQIAAKNAAIDYVYDAMVGVGNLYEWRGVSALGDWYSESKSSDGSEILKRLAAAKEPRGTGMHNVCQCCERLDALRESASRQEGEKE